MNSKERIRQAVSHKEPDRIPMDFGATPTTGITASVVYRLRKALGLDGPVKVTEPYQMLGEVGEDLRRELGIDAVPVAKSNNMFGFRNVDWKPWTLFDGTPVLVPAKFNTEPDENGDILMYPEGDRSAPPSARMPRDGFYFDTIVRQPPIDKESLDVEDNLEEFGPIPREELDHLQAETERLKDSGAALVGNFSDTGFGDIALVPAPFLKHPKGIRDVEEWYISTVTRREYVRAVFEGQCEAALENLPRIHQVVGEEIDVLFVTGTDFGTQRGPFLSPADYRDLYMPFHKRINDWVHENTTWFTFIHSCGGVEPLIGDFIAAGFDILNPVQCSAQDMDPEHLKGTFGDEITFWGGGVDTQKTLPFGTPEEVREEVKKRVEIFAEGGGFVFNTIHNVQANTPMENLTAMFEAFEQVR